MVVGADRVVANGDTANKVGTYQLAIAAKHHGIPFYVAAPSTSCDLSLESGRDIIIEVRPPEELTSINGIPIAAPGKKCSMMSVLFTREEGGEVRKVFFKKYKMTGLGTNCEFGRGKRAASASEFEESARAPHAV